MKATILSLLLTASLTCAQGTTQTTPASTTGAAPAATQSSVSVPSALMRLKFLQGKPDMDAKYYIYVQSASWCGPCRKFMPIIVDAYKELKSRGVEIILVGRDSEEKATIAYANSHNVPFAVLQGAKELEEALPGFTMARGIPHIQVVERGGALMLDAHPQNFFIHSKWKDLLEKWKSDPADSIAPDVDDEAGHYDIVLRNADDVEDMLRAMARHHRGEQRFQSRTPNPGDMVLASAIANDMMAGYGINGRDGEYTLIPAYLDSWRMWQAFNSKNAVHPVNAVDGGWGPRLSKGEHEALLTLKARLEKIVRPGMSELATLLAIHDDLVNRATYRKDGPCTARELIMGGTGSAEAYTRYMFLALNMAGISCHRVVGTEGCQHSWNLVKIDNKWYHLDTAWDDPAATADGRPKAVLSHAYCCVSDATMAKDHKWNRSLYSEATRDYPFSYHKTISTPQELQAALKQAYRFGSVTFEAKLGFNDLSVLQDAGCPVESYAMTDGSLIVIFDRTESGAAPVHLKVEPSSTDSAKAAERWWNVKLNK